MQDLFAVVDCKFDVLFPLLFVFFGVEEHVELVVFALGGQAQFLFRGSAEKAACFGEGAGLVLFLVLVGNYLGDFAQNESPLLLDGLTFLYGAVELELVIG